MIEALVRDPYEEVNPEKLPDFNFVAAGDWGCKNEAKNTFAMMKKRNLNCIQRQVIIRMNPL